MASWWSFRASDPTLADLAQTRIDCDGLVAVGTLRSNGWPRISPVEPLIADGQLYLDTL